MANKLPKPSAHMHEAPQSAMMQHQLHLQTIDVLTKLYSTALTDNDQADPLHAAIKKALFSLLDPFLPSPPPSPVIQ